MKKRFVVLGAGVCTAAFLLYGCSSTNFQDPLDPQVAGKVMGGQAPITGATIQLYAVNTTTNGGPSMPLISPTVTTSDGTGLMNANANAGNEYNVLPAGGFNITGDYTCPTASTQVYLLSTGGNSEQSGGVVNPDIQIMAGLGSCGQLSASTNLIVNEVTTVGMIAAIAPYMTSATAVGSTSADTSALAEEFNVATLYANTATGSAPGPNLPPNYDASSTKLNTVANIMSTCVNAPTATPGDGSTCGALLEAARPVGGTAPTTPAMAVLDILNNPTNNVSSIFTYVGTTPPFQPYDIAAPSVFALPILPLSQTPVASPVADTHLAAQPVTPTFATRSATIDDTTNRTTLSTGASVYSGPITVSASETFKAIAGAQSSSVVSAAYTSAPTSKNIYTYVGGGATGDTHIPDTANDVIREVSASPSDISTAAGGLLSGYHTANDSNAATNATLSAPIHAAIDASGNLYIADTNNHRVRKVAAGTGVITTIAGTGLYGFSGDAGAATRAQLNTPSGVAVDSSGNLYIADTNNNRVRKVSLATGIITTVAGDGNAGFGSDGGQATLTSVWGPRGVAVDSSGDLFIADTGNHRIREVATTGIISTAAGNGTEGYSADGVLATTSEIDGPYDVQVDPSGNLYIADTGNNRVRLVTASSSLISTLAGTGSYGYGGDNGVGTAAKVAGPEGVVVDSSGNVFVADSGNNLIRRIASGTDMITTIVGTRTAGDTGNGAAATSAEVNHPTGVVMDASGRLYIVDSTNNLIRIVYP